jgi:hypothetical protein
MVCSSLFWGDFWVGRLTLDASPRRVSKAREKELEKKERELAKSGKVLFYLIDSI